MKKHLLAHAALLLFAGLLAFQPGQAQAQEAVPAPDPRPSPTAIAATKLSDGTYLKVVYSAPQRRGRAVFGELVPFGEVWRTGANEATEITFTSEVQFGQRTLPAGTYALFTIPGKDRWTVILNSELGQWGAFRYSAEKDVMRLETPAMKLDAPYEAFNIAFEEAEDGVNLVLRWDDQGISVPIRPV